MKEIELVIFDLAGTTIEDTGQVAAAFTTVLGDYGIEVTEDALRQVRGASKREVIRSFIERQGAENETAALARTEQIYNSFRHTLTSMYAEHGVREIAGTSETFRLLERRGIKIALNTGFDRTITEELLDAVRWDRKLFKAVVSGDEVEQGRPAPCLIWSAMERSEVRSAQQVANVGDTVLDLQAGRNAGVRYNIGVLSGAHTRAQLEQAPHTHLVRSVAALSEL